MPQGIIKDVRLFKASVGELSDVLITQVKEGGREGGRERETEGGEGRRACLLKASVGDVLFTQVIEGGREGGLVCPCVSRQ